jgi:hypothetical protein
MRRLANDPVVFLSGVLPVPQQLAESALARQPGLPWPAKLVRCESGEVGLVGEVPRLVEPRAGAAIVRRAVEAARVWLDAAEPDPAATSSDAWTAEELEDLLDETAYPWQLLEDGACRLDVTHDGVVGRMELRRVTAGGLRLCGRGAVGVGDGRSFLAQTRYALEANSRLRLARVSVGSGGGSAAWVVWDVVLPGEVPLEAALREGVGAVATARAVTEAALRALATPAVAEAYLALRTNSRPGNSRRRKE